MEKIFKEFGMVKSIGTGLGIVGLIVAIASIFPESATTSLIMDSHECMFSCRQFPAARLSSKMSAVCE